MATVGRKLAEAQEQKIVADYVLNGSYTAAAEANGVSASTVQRVVRRRPDLVEIANQKKEDMRATMEDYMDSRREQVQEIIGNYLEALVDPWAFEKVTPVQLSTVIGTLIDKWAMLQKNREERGETGGGVIYLAAVEPAEDEGNG